MNQFLTIQLNMTLPLFNKAIKLFWNYFDFSIFKQTEVSKEVKLTDDKEVQKVELTCLFTIRLLLDWNVPIFVINKTILIDPK